MTTSGDDRRPTPAARARPAAGERPVGAWPGLRAMPATSGRDVGLLLLRVTIGVIMFGHGTQKLFGWFGGGGLDATAASFGRLGYPAARVCAVVAGLTEALGGAGLALGFLTPLAGAAILGTMINAMAAVWHGSLYGSDGIEYEVLLAMTGASLALTGPGRYSIDDYLGGLREPRWPVGAAAIVLGLVLAAVVLIIRG
nr:MULTISPECIES: DoxX family protein [Pseudofrankia]